MHHKHEDSHDIKFILLTNKCFNKFLNAKLVKNFSYYGTILNILRPIPSAPPTPKHLKRHEVIADILL